MTTADGNRWLRAGTPGLGDPLITKLAADFADVPCLVPCLADVFVRREDLTHGLRLTLDAETAAHLHGASQGNVQFYTLP